MAIQVTALSGRPSDIQNAVNAAISAMVAAGSGDGTVFIPEGDWTCDQTATGAVNINLSTLPQGSWLNIVGSTRIVPVTTFNGQLIQGPATILRSTVAVPTTTNAAIFTFVVNGSIASPTNVDFVQSQGKHIRFAGLTILGYVPVENANSGNVGISITAVDGFRIDHCTMDSNTNGNVVTSKSKGVIDHNFIDQEYHKTAANASNGPWGYGIIIGGNYSDASYQTSTWLVDILPVLGKYDWQGIPLQYIDPLHSLNTPISTTNIHFTAGPVYIENNTFNLCRHGTAGANFSYDFYVSRYNTYQNTAAAWVPNVDAHGGSRGFEWYNNTTSISPFCGFRGGGGVIFNNTIQNVYNGIIIGSDSLTSTPTVTHPRNFWVWGNTFVGVPDPLYVDANAMDPDALPGTEWWCDIQAYNPITNTYWAGTPTTVYSPPGYTPFTYPHPLTLAAVPTPTTVALGITITADKTLAITGQTVTCTASASGGSPPYTYQWYSNGSPVPGQTASTYSFTSASPASININGFVMDSTGTHILSSTLVITFAAPTTPKIIVLSKGDTLSNTSVTHGTLALDPTTGGISGPPSLAWTTDAIGMYDSWVVVYGTYGGRDWTQMPYLHFFVKPPASLPPNSAFTIEWIPFPWNANEIASPPFTLTPGVWQEIIIDLRTLPGINLVTSWAIRFHWHATSAIGANWTTNIDDVIVSSSSAPQTPQALSCSVAPSSAVLVVGQSETFTASGSGGQSPYTFAWHLDGVSVGAGPTYTFAATTTGQHTLVATVTDATGATANSPAASIAINAPIPPPVASALHTSGYFILDSYGNQVSLRGIGRAGDADSITGNWGGVGNDVFNYAYKWQDLATMQPKVDETLQCMSAIWHANCIRVFVPVNWWWIDKINPFLTYGQGPNVLLSIRDYWDLLLTEAEKYSIFVIFCPFGILDYYDAQTAGNSGGQPGTLTAAGQAFMSTINANETAAWQMWWTSVVGRLGQHPNVIFELWNEPDGDSTAKANWYAYVINAYKTIRGLKSLHLIFAQWRQGLVPGWQEELTWIPDLNGQITAAIGGQPTNIVYTAHCYRYVWNLQWQTTYSGVLSQLLTATMIPCTRTTTTDVPVVFDETGVGLNLTGSALTDELNWWNALLQAAKSLNVGTVGYYWTQHIGWTPDEALVDGTWATGTTSPPPSSAGQLLINAFSVAGGGGLQASTTGPYTATTSKPTIQFSGSASGGTSPYTWHWDFGDGTSDTTQNPAHTYAATISTYNVTLTVTDAVGAVATVTTTASITAPPPSPCFIATVAFGSPLAPQLNVFRRFRDRCLPDLIVHVYYRVGKHLARWIEHRDAAKRYTREVLNLLAGLLE